MTKKKKKHRIAILIDGNNLRHGIKALTGSEDIDWKTWVNQINREHELVYVNYYIGKVTTPLFEKEKVEAQQKLLKDLKKAGINVWLGYFNDQKQEKGVDVQLALDLVVGAMEKHFDSAMLVSGDGDLAHSVQIARHYGTRILLGYIAGTKGKNYRISWRLKSKSDGAVALNEQTLKSFEAYKKKHPDNTHQKKKNEKKHTNSVSAPKKMEEVLLFCDGGSRGNPGPAGCGAVITDTNGKILKKMSKYIGEDTNNQAEYQAVLMGMEELKKMKPTKVRVYLDSKLIVEQVNGNWKVKKKELKPHHKKITEWVKSHGSISFHHIPRSKNTEADKLANEAMDKKK